MTEKESFKIARLYKSPEQKKDEKSVFKKYCNTMKYE